MSLNGILAGLIPREDDGTDQRHRKLILNPRHRRIAVWFDRYMVLVAVMVCVAIFLQASLITHNKSSENVSMPAYILLVIASLSWMCYGILWTDWLVSLSGMVLSAGSIFALVATVSYRPGTTPGAFSTL